MSVGPVDIVVVEFPNESLRTELVDILADLISANTIHILDVVVITKDSSGAVTSVEVDDVDDAVRTLFAELDGEYDSLVSDEDIQRIADGLSNETAAVVVVWENVWLARMAEDLQAAQGTVVMHERIPAEIVEGALADLAELATATSD